MTIKEISPRTTGLGFLVVILAGLSTGLGAAVVFFPRFVKFATRRVLAASLGISGGVMVYVSFVEIFYKSQISFENYLKSQYDDEKQRNGFATLYTTLSFFVGVTLNCIIDYLVRKLSNEHVHNDENSESIDAEPKRQLIGDVPQGQNEIVVPHCIGCSPDPVAELQEWHKKAKAEEEEEAAEGQRKGTLAIDEESDQISAISSIDINDLEALSEENSSFQGADASNVVAAAVEVQQLEKKEKKQLISEQKKLVRMGLQTALAIALHNFPEGLATFIAFIDDPSIGAAFAIAIAIHNIPEGFCVSLPVYYSSGNRFKAFLWGTFSGVTEPIGALIGWLFFRNGLNLALYGVMFGAVGGMMVMITFRELLPTAFRYDPRDTVVTHSIIFGMVVMSLSLVLFKLFS